MALTPSSMLDLGTKNPDFNLINTLDDSFKDVNSIRKKGSLIVFICNHCPM